MNVTHFNVSILLVACFASQLLSDNEPSSLQAPFATTAFAKRISATGRVVDTIQTADNSYVSVSPINSEGKVRSFLVRKIASSGRRVWERILRLQVEDSAVLDTISLAAITQTTDGGYILAGSRFDCSGPYCEFGSVGILIKVLSDGTVRWKKEYSANNEHFTSLVSTADGGVIVTGSTAFNRIILARYTSHGTILWCKSFPSLLEITADPQLVQTPNNSLILVAYAGALVIKVNDSGRILWKKSLKMPKKLRVQTIAATSDNGIVLAGSCYNNCKQLFMVRLKADGSVQAKRKYSPQVASVGPVTDIIQTSDHGFTITGSVTDTGNHSVFVANIDTKGKASFGRTFRINQSGGASIFPLSDGYLLFGSAGRDTIILKLDSKGLRPWCDFVSSPPISRIPFRQLTISEGQIDVAADLFLRARHIAVSSEAVRHHESDLCP